MVGVKADDFQNTAERSDVNPPTVCSISPVKGWRDLAPSVRSIMKLIWLGLIAILIAPVGIALAQTVMVEACINLSSADWAPLQTNTLTCGSLYFSDAHWMNYPIRFYRLRSP
jgi:hypothetical protein